MESFEDDEKYEYGIVRARTGEEYEFGIDYSQMPLEDASFAVWRRLPSRLS
jgi:hypothetical protein